MEKNKNTEEVQPTLLIQDEVIRKEVAEYSLTIINRMDKILAPVPQELRLAVIMAMSQSFETGYRACAKFAQFTVRKCAEHMMKSAQGIIDEMKKAGADKSDPMNYATVEGAKTAYKSFYDSLLSHEEIDITPRMYDEAIKYADDKSNKKRSVSFNISAMKNAPKS